MDQTALVAELRQLAAYEWPRLWGSVYAHREACMAELVTHLEEALADPKATAAGHVVDIGRHVAVEQAEVGPHHVAHIEKVAHRVEVAHAHERLGHARGNACEVWLLEG